MILSGMLGILCCLASPSLCNLRHVKLRSMRLHPVRFSACAARSEIADFAANATQLMPYDQPHTVAYVRLPCERVFQKPSEYDHQWC